jgi:hypothetical protein
MTGAGGGGAGAGGSPDVSAPAGFVAGAADDADGGVGAVVAGGGCAEARFGTRTARAATAMDGARATRAVNRESERASLAENARMEVLR